MHHKRRRPKSRRAGCGLCKPHKQNHASEKEKPSVRRITQERIEELLLEGLKNARELDKQLARVFRLPDADLRVD